MASSFLPSKCSFLSWMIKLSLQQAARFGSLSLCRLFLTISEDKNPADLGGYTPLYHAASNAHVSVCRLILDSVSDKNPANRNGYTPLHVAAMLGHLKICRLFMSNLQQDKNPAIGHPSNCGNTVLHVAAVHGHEEVCKLIMENVDVNHCRNFDGDTPIDLARKSGQSRVIHLLQNSE